MQLERSVSLSKTNMMGYNHLLLRTKQNKTEKKHKDAPRITHIVRSNKKWSALREDLLFWWWKWGCFGASPSFDACTSWIFLGVPWASPSLSFCPYFISSHHSSPPTLENFLHTKLITILISNVSAIKIINPLGSGMTYEKHLLNIRYCSTSFKKLFDQENSKRKR